MQKFYCVDYSRPHPMHLAEFTVSFIMNHYFKSSFLCSVHWFSKLLSSMTLYRVLRYAGTSWDSRVTYELKESFGTVPLVSRVF